jgi:hypothetical protein
MERSVQFICSNCQEYWLLGQNIFGSVEEPPIHHCKYCELIYCDKCYDEDNKTCLTCKEA